MLVLTPAVVYQRVAYSRLVSLLESIREGGMGAAMGNSDSAVFPHVYLDLDNLACCMAYPGELTHACTSTHDT